MSFALHRSKYEYKKRLYYIPYTVLSSNFWFLTLIKIDIFIIETTPDSSKLKKI